MSVVNVRVRINDFLTDRRYAICVGRPGHRAWVLPLGVARRLHRDLGEAIEAVERLNLYPTPAPSGAVPAPALAGEGVSAPLAAESGR